MRYGQLVTIVANPNKKTSAAFKRFEKGIEQSFYVSYVPPPQREQKIWTNWINPITKKVTTAIYELEPKEYVLVKHKDVDLESFL